MERNARPSVFQNHSAPLFVIYLEVLSHAVIGELFNDPRVVREEPLITARLLKIPNTKVHYINMW